MLQTTCSLPPRTVLNRHFDTLSKT